MKDKTKIDRKLKADLLDDSGGPVLKYDDDGNPVIDLSNDDWIRRRRKLLKAKQDEGKYDQGVKKIANQKRNNNASKMKENPFNLPEPVKIRGSKNTFTTKSGKLRKDLLPASYCDTSFLIDYWLSMQLMPEPSYGIDDEEPHYKIIRGYINRYINRQKHLGDIYKIRQKLEDMKNLTTPVYSTIAVFELSERIAEGCFLEEVLKATDISTIQWLRGKEVGGIISRLWKEANKIKKRDKYSDSPLVNFTLTIFENMCNYSSEWLHGILPVDFENITIRTPRDFNKLITLSAYQIGVADILHLVSAKRLGCKYFITLDKDFERAKEDIERIFGFKVLNNRPDILSKI